MIDKKKLYAVVGVSNNQEKYGYKIFKDLLDVGYDVVAIHPTEKNILGQKVFSTLYEVDRKIDVVIFVVPPVVTEVILNDVLKLGIQNVWMQPGAESDKAILFCQQNGINVISNSCIMIERKK